MSFSAPLFPLNTVLFPGIPLHLHIFEDRYKLLINDCILQKKPFGVVLIQQGAEALGPLAKPYNEGCLAQITEVQPLSEGRMNIVAVGTKRFRTLSLHTEHDYLVGEVETLPFDQEIQTPAQYANQLQSLLRKYLKILNASSYAEIEVDNIPEAPVDLAYLAAYILNIPPQEKQTLLTLSDAESLLQQVLELYRREIYLLPALLTQMPTGIQTTFSNN